MRLLTGLLCGCSLLLVNAVPTFAQNSKDGPVYTDPNQVDTDYSYQGEYRGWQRSRPSARSSEPVALQVIALGEGKFAASKYYGGLPGEGWFGGSRYELSGELTGDVVQLRSDDYSVMVDGETAIIMTPDGRRAGELQKVHRVSPTMGAAPPPEAIVLFDGTSTEHFKGGKITEEGYLLAGADTVEPWTDFRLHGEFRIPYKPLARGQARGNSGFYLQSRYEVQVLDSFGLEGIENEGGSLYRTRRPDINMSYPPLQWQTYDIELISPRFDEQGNKLSNMRITVWHNGVLIHNNVEIENKTGAGKPEGPEPLPTKLQEHSNPVVFRNIWIVPMDRVRDSSKSWVNVPLKHPPVPVSSYQPVGFNSLGY